MRDRLRREGYGFAGAVLVATGATVGSLGLLAWVFLAQAGTDAVVRWVWR